VLLACLAHTASKTQIDCSSDPRFNIFERTTKILTITVSRSMYYCSTHCFCFFIFEASENFSASIYLSYILYILRAE
jgi:hypothetical protein